MTVETYFSSTHGRRQESQIIALFDQELDDGVSGPRTSLAWLQAMKKPLHIGFCEA